MTKAEKQSLIDQLSEQFADNQYWYVADSSTLNVEAINKFRRKCFEAGIEFKVAKNTLIKKALEKNEGNYDEVFPVLAGPTAIMFSAVSNAPAKVLKEFREDNDKPVLKAAYIDSDVFIGDDQIEVLSKLKSKEELIGEIIGLLQSPAKNVISALGSGGQTIGGIIKTLSEREEN